MTDHEREEIISWLIMWTGWSRKAFDKMSNLELLKEYDRQNKMNKG